MVVGARLVLADRPVRVVGGREEVEAEREGAAGLCEVEAERAEEAALAGGAETDDESPEGTLGFLTGARAGAEEEEDAAAPPGAAAPMLR